MIDLLAGDEQEVTDFFEALLNDDADHDPLHTLPLLDRRLPVPLVRHAEPAR